MRTSAFLCEESVRETDRYLPFSHAKQVLRGALPDFADLDLRALSRQSSHTVLAAVASALLPRMLPGAPAVAFYEDGPYQL